MRVVYIASQYSVGNKEGNVKVQMEIAHRLMDFGLCPIVPLLDHYLNLHKDRPYEEWMAIDFERIRRCDVLLRIPGESPGADREVEFAKSLNIPVVYSIEELVKCLLLKT